MSHTSQQGALPPTLTPHSSRGSQGFPHCHRGGQGLQDRTGLPRPLPGSHVCRCYPWVLVLRTGLCPHHLFHHGAQKDSLLSKTGQRPPSPGPQPDTSGPKGRITGGNSGSTQHERPGKRLCWQNFVVRRAAAAWVNHTHWQHLERVFVPSRCWWTPVTLISTTREWSQEMKSTPNEGIRNACGSRHYAA